MEFITEHFFAKLAAIVVAGLCIFIMNKLENTMLKMVCLFGFAFSTMFLVALFVY